MFCKNCGEENPENAVFCRNCGKSLKEEEVKKAEVIDTPQNNYQNTDYQQNTYYQQQTGETSSASSSNDNNDMMCCCGCLIAVFIVFAIMAFI